MWKYIFSCWMFAAYSSQPIQAILTDIEGTTTSISFVHDTLFPYAKNHVEEYLSLHSSEPSLIKIISEVKQIENIPDATLDQVAEILLTWMKQDKKITPLKTLQGMMWKSGFEQGNFQGHVYEDAFKQLNYWKESGFALYVYSSGSIAAQKLLFSHSTYGDLSPLFSGYFDTQVGGKKESTSYQEIAKQLNLAPAKILFLSDVVEELDAAKTAGMQTKLIVRGVSTTPVNCNHPSATNFFEVFN